MKLATATSQPGRTRVRLSAHASERRVHTIPAGEAMRLDGRRGELLVTHGRVWLTVGCDARDLILVRGQRVALAAGHAAVLESANRDEAAIVEWRPRRPDWHDAWTRLRRVFELRLVPAAMLPGAER